MNEKLKQRILEIAAKHDPIQIKCEGAGSLPLDVIADFQGDLKKLSNDNMIRLVKSLFLNGFCAPFFVWQNGGEYYALDGHQRVKALCAIREAGLPIPSVFPVAFIDAVDKQDARKKLLAITSQYGDVQRDALKEWLEEIEEDARETFRLLDKEVKIDTSDDISNEEGDGVRLPFGDERDSEEITTLLNRYDIIAASFSGGKDSIAMILYLKNIGIDVDKIKLVYCLVPGLSWIHEDDYVKYCANKLGCDLVIVSGGDEKLLCEKLKKRGYPGQMLKWCNSDFKVSPLNKYFKTISGSYIMAMGTRAEESARREKMIPRGTWGGRDFIYPIFNFDFNHVFSLVESSGISMHPAYRHFDRFSCSACFNTSSDDFAILREHYPDEYRKALRLISIGFENETFRRAETSYPSDLLKRICQCNLPEKENNLHFSNWWMHEME